jgi:hypothetical protein
LHPIQFLTGLVRNENYSAAHDNVITQEDAAHQRCRGLFGHESTLSICIHLNGAENSRELRAEDGVIPDHYLRSEELEKTLIIMLISGYQLMHNLRARGEVGPERH